MYKSTFDANLKNSGKYYNFTAFKGQKFIFSNKEGDGGWGATFKKTIIFFLGHFFIRIITIMDNYINPTFNEILPYNQTYRIRVGVGFNAQQCKFEGNCQEMK